MQNNKSIPVIMFTANDSIYDSLNCDTWPIERNAINCKKKEAAIYHPPCRSWGRLRLFSHIQPGEHLLSVWSILRIWKYNGILEHPAGSKLWSLMKLPMPGSKIDIHNGFSISIDQHWFGHKCKKNTWIYIKGIRPAQLPAMPMNFDLIQHSISHTGKKNKLKEVSKKYRSSTPVELAKWLIQVLEIINNESQVNNT